MNQQHLPPGLSFSSDLANVDWQLLKQRLGDDDFDNGRTPGQLLRSFTNSATVCLAVLNGEVIGTARALSDGVCNAYVVDVWTWTPWRNHGIAREMMMRLCTSLPGQHIYLQADDDLVPFYEKLGLHPHPNGMAIVAGQWLSGADDP